VRNQEQGAGMRSTPDTLSFYFKACIILLQKYTSLL